MRAIVDAKAFSEALSNVGKVLQKSTVPVLEGVLVRFKNGRCSLTASDFTTWLTAALPARGEEFVFALQKPREVTKACRYYQGELTLEVHEIHPDHPAVTLSSGRRSGTFDVFPAKDYPLSPPMEENVSFTANAAVLLKRIERVKYAVRAPQGIYDEPQRTCVQFSGNDVFCVDGHRAACDTDTALTFPRPFLTWGSSLAFLKLMGGSEVTVRIGTNHIWFSTDAVSICAHKEGFETFRLRDAVPNTFSEEFYVSPKEFLRELEYLEGFQGKHRSPVRFCGGKMILHNTPDRCFTAVEIDGKSGLVIGFDPHFMRDALRQFGGEERVKTKLSGVETPIIIEAEDRNDFALVLPVNLCGARAA